MKLAILLLAVVLPATFCYYQRPNYHNMPTSVNTRSAPVYKSLGHFFQKLHLTAKRCANTFDESCINGGLNGAGSDEIWISGGSSPGKRCVNTFDESCANGDLNGAGSDESWLNGGGTPGKRCVNTFDNSCFNGNIPDAGSDESWLTGGNVP